MQYLLQENGGNLLQENTGKIIVENRPFYGAGWIEGVQTPYPQSKEQSYPEAKEIPYPSAKNNSKEIK